MTDVESATITSPGAAPIRGAICRRRGCGRSIQPCRSSSGSRPSPHSRRTTSLEPRRGGGGQGAERVAVEVDDAVGQEELVAEGRERIGVVHRRRVRAGDRGHAGDHGWSRTS